MTGKLSAQKKIYLVSAVWLAVVFLMFNLGFKFLDSSNKKTREKIQEQTKEEAVLINEKESYDSAKKDLDELKAKTVQPEEFFSKDITLVNEIKFLEELGSQYGVKLNLSGLSGTVKTAPKAKTQSDIVIAPYGINVAGSFPNVLAFLEHMENLPFLTQLTGFSLSAAGGKDVVLNMSANFYLER